MGVVDISTGVLRVKIPCCNDRGLLPIEEIHEKIEEKVTMFLDVAD